MDFTKIPSPCFVLDEKRLRKNLELIDYVQKSARVEIILAFKGFAMWSAFPLVKQYVKGATASSLYEARLCFEEMKTKAHVFAPAYFPNEFNELMGYSSHFVFNSLAQFHRFYPGIKKSGQPISCGIRVNPEMSDVQTDLYNPSSPKSRLGVLKEHFPKELPEGVDGLHFHVLCESTSYALENVLEVFEQRFGIYLPKLKWINMGGGHLMTREGYDVEHLIQVLKRFKEKHQVEVILEPGSAFAWDTGVLVSEVQDIVVSRGVKTAILDVSFTAHMPDTLEMPYRPRIVGAKDPDQNSKHMYRLGGVSCLAGDFMEEYDFGKELNVGDRVVFEDMIHYTMVKTTMFNGVQHPAIAIWKENNELKIVREFNYQDFKERLS
ncbi:MAG TPA: carboxynorspermidine decarboxylase [Marinilabiliales bacterium]|nr:MAG: carboxynorspermidine decarboxylase [Bacteroidetes bacterium GWC2_40_13]OFX74636.1 MAG: carboxynorspermidine decarboxylase [Bacteroidetes bacterium GWD2_40_43]OFX93712.1 MAG: carboxynorspermidine decarboxylase [Bacteroidetes bacterium GWE2_40_63]OFY18543.1 MAG: carboxynorspermidine decarboxylase [Bacteroidetes bacterium GWF2_40_13]OFZ32094.1 MAG: carboxynorspermidine decarboxylase [Bacteroidetes bacterium RIFOXYC2_FULL_40_12]HAM99066.1 carboxynorspermidine decarboxylase [Marinilabiliale